MKEAAFFILLMPESYPNPGRTFNLVLCPDQARQVPAFPEEAPAATKDKKSDFCS